MFKRYVETLWVIVCLAGVTCAGTAAATTALFDQDITFETSHITGIGVNDRTDATGDNLVRRDPSDVIKLDDTYHVFYTRSKHSDYSTYGGGNIYIGGGYYSTVWYATSTDGHDWTERGKVIDRGESGKFDSNSAFTPGVVKAPDGEVYVFYTGVPLGFQNNNTTDYTNIGAARLSFDNDGAITGATRLNNGDPILENTQGQTHNGNPLFDTYRVDDSRIVLRDFSNDGTLDIGLYYKGRAEGGGPGGTKMGLAIASSMDDPFIHDANSTDGSVAQDAGHEVMVFNYGDGIASVVTRVGHGIYYDERGVDFEKVADFTGDISAPGAYRPELTNPDYVDGVSWGISMVHDHQTHRPYLVRWDATGLFIPEPGSLALLGGGMLLMLRRRGARV